MFAKPLLQSAFVIGQRAHIVQNQKDFICPQGAIKIVHVVIYAIKINCDLDTGVSDLIKSIKSSQ